MFCHSHNSIPPVASREYVLDATKYYDVAIDGKKTYYFFEYDRQSNKILTGSRVIRVQCPGILVGVIHRHGQEAFDKWLKDNPQWFERFKRQY